ncbi:MAG TPA: hypothetical protein VFA75_08140 [Nevskia sp.]|nr:hypothetical protein [Nevskia sp.]
MNEAMAEHFYLVSSYVGLVELVAQFIMIVLQLRLYRSTRHNSAMLLAASTALGIINVVLMYSPRLLKLPIEQWLLLHEAAAVVFSIQVVVGIAGAVMLFRAFETALSQARPF